MSLHGLRSIEPSRQSKSGLIGTSMMWHWYFEIVLSGMFFAIISRLSNGSILRSGWRKGSGRIFGHLQSKDQSVEDENEN